MTTYETLQATETALIEERKALTAEARAIGKRIDDALGAKGVAEIVAQMRQLRDERPELLLLVWKRGVARIKLLFGMDRVMAQASQDFDLEALGFELMSMEGVGQGEWDSLDRKLRSTRREMAAARCS